MKIKNSIKYEKNCVKYLQKSDKNAQIRNIQTINQLLFGDVKILQGNHEDYRLRVGNFRIIFCKDDKELLISIIGIVPRGEVYK